MNRVADEIPDLELSLEELKNFALSNIDIILQSNNCSLLDFPNMPKHDTFFVNERGSRLIFDE
ncbi:hypothetical protein JHK82_033675 [Glycine max]|nr:hypothetical protein JHK82_033675 [Glycine max]KAG5140249.1 hypothetical protein JHK84_034017 [Glycine max]